MRDVLDVVALIFLYAMLLVGLEMIYEAVKAKKALTKYRCMSAAIGSFLAVVSVYVASVILR